MMNHKTLTKLHQKKYRNQYNLFLVEGTKSVKEVFDSPSKVVQVCVSKNFLNQNQQLLNSLLNKDFRNQNLTILDDHSYSRLSSSITPSGIIAVVEKPKTNLNLSLTDQLIPILEDIRDPGNMGTILRTADWFGVKNLVLIGGADPYQPKVVQASMGSIFKLNLIQVDNPNQIIFDLKDKGYKLMVTKPENSGNTTELVSKTNGNIAVVFGNESRGTSAYIDNQADLTWSIPSNGSAESLNVGVSFGIFLYEFRKNS